MFEKCGDLECRDCYPTGSECCDQSGVADLGYLDALLAADEEPLTPDYAYAELEPSIAEKAEMVLLTLLKVVDVGGVVAISDGSVFGGDAFTLVIEPGETFDEFVTRVYEEQCVVRGRCFR